jgi:hypothetical protein
MVWILGYVVIGLVYAGITSPKAIKATMNKFETEEEKNLALIIGTVFCAALITPLWPMFLTFKLFGGFKKLT